MLQEHVVRGTSCALLLHCHLYFNSQPWPYGDPCLPTTSVRKILSYIFICRYKPKIDCCKSPKGQTLAIAVDFIHFVQKEMAEVSNIYRLMDSSKWLGCLAKSLQEKKKRGIFRDKDISGKGLLVRGHKIERSSCHMLMPSQSIYHGRST